MVPKSLGVIFVKSSSHIEIEEWACAALVSQLLWKQVDAPFCLCVCTYIYLFIWRCYSHGRTGLDDLVVLKSK